MTGGPETDGLQRRALVQQGYDLSPEEQCALSGPLRFTPAVCLAGALVGLALRAPTIHFVLAALGIVPFWFPRWHPVDLLYERVLRPLWNGAHLPPNPLPRRFACVMGGTMNLAIGIAFELGSVTAAYVLGAILVTLMLVVISTHFCLASWILERALFGLGVWKRPIEPGEARRLLSAGGVLVDVRSPAEFAQGHLAGAVNVPLETIEAKADDLPGGELVLTCRSGLRSREAARLLRRRGRANVRDAGAMARIA